MGKFLKFSLLLWKNWKLQLRRPVITLFEILLPAAFCLILLQLRTLSTPEVFPNATTYSSYSIENGFPNDLMNNFKLGRFSALGIAYTPNTNLTTNIIRKAGMRIRQTTNVSYFPIFTGLDTEDDLVTFATYSNGSTKNSLLYLGGVVFLNSDYSSSLPSNITYKLRFNYLLRNSSQSNWGTSSNFPRLQTTGPRNGNNTYNPTPGYYIEGFLTLQNAINRAIMEELNPSLERNPNYTTLDVNAKLFPFPPHIKDGFIVVLQSQLAFFLMISLIFIALNIPKEVVHEKERKLKEAMKMMGLNNWLHWLAWFAKYFVFLTVTVFIMTVILCPPGRNVNSTTLILRYADTSTVFVFLLLYAVSTICFCFMVSVFFNKANSAAAAGGILFFLTYLPFIYISQNYSSMTMRTKLAACLSSNTAMSIGAYLYSKFEGAGEGVQWTNIRLPVSVDDDFPLSYVFGMLIFDSILYILIMWYVEAVRPGDFGIPEKPYFFFLPSYWCGTKRNFGPSITPQDSNGILKSSEMNCEAEPVGIRAGIQIKGLTKAFKTKGVKRMAVENLNLNFYEGQITALLGHNGAGKTTTMFMLTGFMPPTSGTAIVNGYDVLNDISGVRSSLGLCPQHDILFDNLTVDEHLEFFAKLKGCPPKKRKEEKDYYINTLGLQEKRHAYAQTLSGGQKRKLSVAIALIGNSKIVILDEPTSGMDPSARRLMWDVLQKQRAGRTMVLSTHFMDEADNLGDRIAIMAEGVLQCCGTSLFLKNRFGAGYHMVMVKKPACVVQTVIDVVKRHVPTARMESNVGAELSFVLPHEEVSAFSPMFAELEERKDELGIMSYGASVTTMEEVFLKVGHGRQAGTDDEVRERLQNVHNSAAESDKTQLPPTDGFKEAIPMTEMATVESHVGALEKKAEPAVSVLSVANTLMWMNTGMDLRIQQFRAMLIKRILYTGRNWILTLSQIIMPTFFSALTAAIITSQSSTTTQPSLHLVIDSFGNVTSLFEDTLTPGIPNDSVSLSSSYAAAFPTGQIVSQVDDVQNAIISVGKNSIANYTFKRIIAASFAGKSSLAGRSSVTALFNAQPYHSAAVSLSYVSNAMLNHFVNSTYAITTVNHPLPKTLEDQASDLASKFNGQSFSYATNLQFGMSFLASSFVVFLIKERSTKVKHSQFVSGVKWYSFWLATFAWDFINYLVPALLILVIFAAFKVTALSGAQSANLLVVLLLYGLALLPNMYLLQFLFETPASGYVVMTFYNILSGIVPNLVVTILDLLNEKNTSSALRWVFNTLFPNFNLGEAIVNMYTNYDYRDLCENQVPTAYGNKSLDSICELIEQFNRTFTCCISRPSVCGDSGCLNYTDNFYAWKSLGMGRPITFLAGQSVLSWLVISLIETEIVRQIFNYLRPKKIVRPVPVAAGLLQDDDDVVAERRRLLPNPSHEIIRKSPVVIYGLSKYFKEHHAVNNLSVAIPRGECFGLLGVNGAGKTTTFKMLTGDESVSGGNALLNGYSVRNDILKVHQQIGYCPQFDALVDQMTGEETLYMFARLRGIPERKIPGVVKELMDAFILTPHANKLTERYSGGNKRKLSTAIALIGDPPVVFLDEPTTGMDPVARRMLWDSLSAVRDSGKTLILTSHSMEECEALCTRMAIMVNGQFRCLGSTQHLKTKFGSGYSLVARLGYPQEGVAPDLNPLISFVEETFPGSVLKDIHQNLVQYQIDSSELTWSKIFGTLEQAKARLGIEDYSVSQTTLEQVFINFARAQAPPRDDNEQRGCCSKLSSSLCFCCVPDIVVEEADNPVQ